jgi:DNA-binding CsgD family transcriptional regulator
MQSLTSGWSLTDLGSRNGTLVRGNRLFGAHALRHGDDIAIGRTKLVFRYVEQMGMSHTQGAAPVPELTPRERDVLRALCRPLFDGRAFSEPASAREIAAALTVTEPAVQQHLLHLYDKFGIPPGAKSRRLALANEAISRSAVTLADLNKP